MKLDDSISIISGVGAERAKKLNTLGIFTVFDLVSYYPRDYEDRSIITPIPDINPDGVYTIQGNINTKPKLAYINGLKIVKAIISDGSGELEAVWFNQPYLVNHFKSGVKYSFTGKVTERLGILQLQSPDYEIAGKSVASGGIVPLYRLIPGVTHKLLRKLVESVLSEIQPDINEFLPGDIISRHNLMTLSEAVRNIHFPLTRDSFYAARKRLVFNELLLNQLALLRLKKIIKKSSAIKLTKIQYCDMLKKLPYALTKAQKRTLDEITGDFASGSVMTRLVQGDVGSGKTAVALIACSIVMNNGYQSLLMAPTEVLARQHYEFFSKMLGDDYKTVFLSGSLTVKEKREVREQIQDGGARMIIGTHALIEDDVITKNAGLVITDEQHRFGVSQRLRFSEKAGIPHTLIMSATPIPRTLALVLYGDLDISVIDELPAGRQVVDTFVIDSQKRARALAFIEKELEKGRQAYIICPAIDENDNLALRAVTSHIESIKKAFPRRRTEMLHGKLKNSQKDEIMSRFSAGEIDILVSTTVIEVGVNVPNASVMFIENAERFGLSQLHQLRGRVGRGSEKSYCILLSDSRAKNTHERLNVMRKTNDGFVISELDLKLRGGGDFFGTKQSGMQEFKIANLYTDMWLLPVVQSELEKLVNSRSFIATGEFDPLLEQELSKCIKNETKFSL